MKIKEKEFKKIIQKIKNEENYNNISQLISNTLNNTIDSDHLFYTIEYVDIITNDNKRDNSYKNDFEQDVLKMLLYTLKNKKITFEKRYFDIILELIKLDQGLVYDGNNFSLDEDYNKKIDAIEYNKLLFFLSIDYSNHFIKSSNDQLFNLTINQNFQDSFTNLLDTFAYYEKSTSLFEELSKYSPIICNILLKNKDYIVNLENRKLNESDYNIELEYNFFYVLVSVFISNIEELNYNYSIISEATEKLINYIKDNFFSIFNNNNEISVDKLEELKQIIFAILIKLNSQKQKRLN